MQNGTKYVPTLVYRDTQMLNNNATDLVL